MNECECFVRDYFTMGEDAWLEHYAGKIPTGVSPQYFVAEMQRQGLGARFINECDWKDGRIPRGYLYLIAEASGQYAIYVVERAIPLLQGTYNDLDAAFVGKAEIIFTFLRLSALPIKPLQRD